MSPYPDGIGMTRLVIFYSARTFFGKATSSVGHLLAGVGLDVIGFPEHAVPGQVSADVLFRLGIFYAPIAAIPALISVYCYGLYRISRRRHEEIATELMERKAVGGQPGIVYPNPPS